MTIPLALIVFGAVLLEAALSNRSLLDTALGRAGQPLTSDSGGSAGSATPSQDSATPTVGGSGTFDGKPVAHWIIPALKWAREHGYWHGQVTSGVRSYVEQVSLYQRYKEGGNIAAKPGQSNHEGTRWPRGAVDVTDPEGLNEAMKHYPGVLKLKWGYHVIGDYPHFSATGR